MNEEMRLLSIIQDGRNGSEAQAEAQRALYILNLRKDLNRSSTEVTNQAAELNRQLAVARNKYRRVIIALDRLDRIYKILMADIPVNLNLDSYDIYKVDPVTKKEINPTFSIGEDGANFLPAPTTKDDVRRYIDGALKKLMPVRASIQQESRNVLAGVTGLEAKITNLGFKPDPNYGAPGNPAPSVEVIPVPAYRPAIDAVAPVSKPMTPFNKAAVTPSNRKPLAPVKGSKTLAQQRRVLARLRSKR